MSLQGIFFALVFGNLIVLIVNFILSAIAVYFSAYFLKIRGNTLPRAFLVVLSGLVIGILQDMLFPVTFFFSWIIALLAFLYAIKSIYNIDWSTALVFCVLAIFLAVIIGAIVTPLIVGAILSLPEFSSFFIFRWR